jgi:S1-C subfamily serine protease
MRIIILALVCGVLTYLAVTIAVDNYDTKHIDKKLHKQCLYPTVEISVGSQAQNIGTVGTGVIIRSDKHGKLWHNVMLTAAHVVSRQEPYIIRVTRYDTHLLPVGFDYYPVNVFASDSESDLAVLVFSSDKKMATAKIDVSGKEYFGHEVFKIGGGADQPLRIDRGDIGHVFIDSFRFSAFTTLGDSGCAIFDSDYEVIGLTRAIIYRDMPNGRPYFLFNMAIGSRVSLFKKWSAEKDGFLDFVFKDTPLPDVYQELDKIASEPEEIWVPIP